MPKFDPPELRYINGLGHLIGVQYSRRITSYQAGIAIGLAVRMVSARGWYGWFDQLGTFVSMVGFSVSTFFSGVLLIVVFSVELGWFPSIYDTTPRVAGWDSLIVVLRGASNDDRHSNPMMPQDSWGPTLRA